MFETYDSIVLICTGRGTHLDQEVAEIIPLRPRLDLEEMSRQHEGAGHTLPAGVKRRVDKQRRMAEEVGFGIAGTLHRGAPNPHGWGRSVGEVKWHARRARWAIHISRHRGCDLNHPIDAERLFVKASQISAIAHTRRPRVDVSKHRCLRF